ncbi:MAG: ERF family protein [Anaerolineales bacterium]|nr:ERF family protein [Anaerolineales bacterium]
MNKSEQINDLAAALAAAQAELRNPVFDSQNPHFKSKFASLAQVRDTITPTLAKHGLSVTQLATNDDQGRPSVETILLHKSGQWLSSTLAVPVAKADAHGAGSAITYARRYSLMAIVNVVGDEDDDGNSAVAGKQAEDQHLRLIADAIIAAHAKDDRWRMYETWVGIEDNEDKMRVWDMLKPHSKVRSAIKDQAAVEKASEPKVAA